MDVIVVGAGIVGASCAFHLARRGARVLVVERESAPATGSTGRSAAGIRHQFSHPENVRMSLYSSRFLSRFAELTGVDPGYRPIGYLFLLPPSVIADWTRQQEMQRRLGARVELLQPPELRDRFPFVDAEGLAAASYGPDDGVLDPHAVTLGFLRGARSAGAEVRLVTEVESLEAREGGWRLTTNGGTLWADVVVNAAGPQAGELARRAGLRVPVRPYRRNVYVTAPLDPFPHPAPLTVDLETGVYLRSEGRRIMIGLSRPDEAEGEILAVDWSWLEVLLERALPRFPFLERAELDRRSCWAGLYEITPDHLPVLGRMPGAEGFVNACGFSGHGVQHAPATGLAIAEEILDGSAHSFDIGDFRIERFAGAEQEQRAAEANIV